MKMLGNRIAIKQIEEKRSPSGLLIGKLDVEEWIVKGEITAVGPDVVDLSVGDVVVYNELASTPVGDERVTTENEIYVVIEGESDG